MSRCLLSVCVFVFLCNRLQSLGDVQVIQCFSRNGPTIKYYFIYFSFIFLRRLICRSSCYFAFVLIFSLISCLPVPGQPLTHRSNMSSQCLLLQMLLTRMLSKLWRNLFSVFCRKMNLRLNSDILHPLHIGWEEVGEIQVQCI